MNGERWDTGTHAPFLRYYEDESSSAAAHERFDAIRTMLLRALGPRDGPLDVADIGCGAGTQARMWALQGHRVVAADINAALLDVGRARARDAGVPVGFALASATELPWGDASVDLCIVPELLEHVVDWRGVVAECVRILRPGGALFFSTSNRLCPVQEEFTLPLYSWYPAFIKRRCVRLALTSRPEIAGHATYPAVNWFTFYGLRGHLGRFGLTSMDRFDLIDPRALGAAGRVLMALLKAVPPLRFLGHVATPYTVLLAFKPR